MVKHKKPTPPPEAEAKDVPEDTPAPPTEAADSPGKVPKDTPAEISERTRKLNFLFWLRIVLAVGAGCAATFLFDGIEGEERRWTSIMFMIAVFLASIIFARSMNMRLPRADRKKIVTQGIGSYVFIYLFSWITSYTLVNLPSGGGALSTPFG